MNATAAIRQHRVPIIALGAAVLLLALLWRPIVAWFSGDSMGAEEGATTRAAAGALAIDATFETDPPREKGSRVRLDVKDAAGQPLEDAEVEVEYLMPAMGAMPEMRGSADVEGKGDGRYAATFDLPMGGGWTLIVRVKSEEASGEARFTFTVGTSGLTAVSGSAAMAPGADGPAPPDLPATELPAPVLDQLQRALDAYERVRARLASDELDGVSAHAGEVAEAIRAAAAALASGPSEVADCLGQGAAAAEKLAGATTLEAARAEFGELSRFLVALAASDPRLREGWHIFECPMAKGFGRWLQRSPDLENPYMGKAMPACGSSSVWKAAVAAPEAGASHEGHGHEGDDPAFYTCSMHPSVKQKGPGTCPICSMDLEAVTYNEHETGVILVDDARRKRIGVVTEEVKRAPMTVTVRAVGHVTYDETRLKDVTVKFKGWIGKLHVEETGQAIKKGQPLLNLYSPELFAAQQEYLLALSSRAAAEKAGTTARSDYLVRAAEKKLRLWDLTSAQIARIARRGEPIEEIPILSPASGFVIEKDVVEGAAVEPGQRLFRIAALDKVWLDAQVYEADLARIKKGTKAKVTLPYQPGRTIEGTVSYVYPYLDPATRTGRVRIELPNKELDLKPDMYANVELAIDVGERLQVPMSAVLYTGPRRLVFVDLGGGKLRPQEVELGARSGEMAEVLRGLEEGQTVVTSGNFLIAAESRIRSAAAFWGTEEDKGAGQQQDTARDQATGSTENAPGEGGHAGH